MQQYEAIIKSQEQTVDSVNNVVREVRSTKQLLIEVVNEEIALANQANAQIEAIRAEAQGKIDEANVKIEEQNQYLAGLLGLPREAVPSQAPQEAPIIQE